MRPDIFFHLVTYKVSHQQDFKVSRIFLETPMGRIILTPAEEAWVRGICDRKMWKMSPKIGNKLLRRCTIMRSGITIRISRLSKGVIDRC
ncbi:hypothetical protein M422DRAFT_34478 [Sphaerobolus stellatus SS14]|uniref:Uncharacterized protein n=1 Tax=Sphaerobolus stellatus (strain SS14) TaxID=990650 RepID=A0A0C9UMC3_SPHS4|nr:hypothetical protein M422DRAFT_34478 [Sphaerobolus stellatus SS14]